MARDDEDARRRRAEELRRVIDELGAGRAGRRPASPREFTDQKAREAAQRERREAERERKADEDDDEEEA